MGEEDWERKDACILIVITSRKEEVQRTGVAGQIGERLPDLSSRKSQIL